MWVKKSHSSIFFWPILGTVPSLTHTHLLTSIEMAFSHFRWHPKRQRDKQRVLRVGRAQRLEPVKSGVFWPTWSSTVFLGFLGSKPINLEWTHQSKSILHRLPTLSPDHPKSIRRSVVHSLPGCPFCQRRARVLGASFLGGTRVRPPMSSYDHHFQPESRFGTCFC